MREREKIFFITIFMRFIVLLAYDGERALSRTSFTKKNTHNENIFISVLWILITQPSCRAIHEIFNSLECVMLNYQASTSFFLTSEWDERQKKTSFPGIKKREENSLLTCVCSCITSKGFNPTERYNDEDEEESSITLWKNMIWKNIGCALLSLAIWYLHSQQHTYVQHAFILCFPASFFPCFFFFLNKTWKISPEFLSLSLSFSLYICVP